MGNIYLKYRPNSSWKLNLNYKFGAKRDHGAFPLTSTMQQALDEPFQLNQNSVSKMVDNVSNASLSIRHEGRHMNISSQTAYQSNYRYYEEPIDGDFSAKDIVSIVNNYGKPWNKVKTWTQELRISSLEESSQRVSWMAGAFGFLTDDPVKQGSYFGEDAEIYGAEPNTTILTINEGKQRGDAVFGQANIALHNKLDLTVGLRYDWEKSKITGKSKMLKGENGESAVINPDTTGEGSYRALSPEAILSYQMTPEHLLFVSFKRGFRAGGISEVSEDPSNPPLKTFGPEYSNNIELGLKNDFLNNRIRWNLSFFYTRVNELQVSQLILPEALTVTKNVGKLRSFGLESEFTALLGRYFSVNWNAGYTNAEFTELAKAGEEGGNEDLSGNKQLFSPEFTS